jgi:hypothetical protein
MTRSDVIELQRKDVEQFFRILDCKIIIEINPDLKTAKYKYSYKINVLRKGLNFWREVFDYSKDHVRILGAHDSEGGLKDTMNSNGRYTTLTIDFRKELSKGSNYQFEYEVITKIESISKIHRLLGGRGAVWFWCSHEYAMDSISAYYNLPKGVIALASHPAGEITNHSVTISRNNLTPNEFFSGIIQVEKKIFGLNASWGDRIYQLFWIFIGAIVSLAISELVTYLKTL